MIPTGYIEATRRVLFRRGHQYYGYPLPAGEERPMEIPKEVAVGLVFNGVARPYKVPHL